MSRFIAPDFDESLDLDSANYDEFTWNFQVRNWATELYKTVLGRWGYLDSLEVQVHIDREMECVYLDVFRCEPGGAVHCRRYKCNVTHVEQEFIDPVARGNRALHIFDDITSVIA